MNDENSELLRMLEEAMPIEGAAPIGDAAVRDETSSGLDPETAALRKGWVGLCRLIEAEAGDAGHFELPSVAGKSCESLNEVVAPLKRQQSPLRPRWLLAGLAATLLLAVGVTAALRIIDRWNGQPPAPQPNRPLIAHDGKASRDSANHGAAPAPDKAPTGNPDERIAAVDHLQWGDSVDDEITAVGRATALVRQDWYVQSSGIGAVETGINDLQQELDQGPL